PHIRAASIEDALFLQGYVTAQDRLWQMDGLRRFAGGTLAEILGPAFLESDRESRKLRMRRIAEEAYVTLPADDRAAFAASTRCAEWPTTARDRMRGFCPDATPSRASRCSPTTRILNTRCRESGS